MPRRLACLVVSAVLFALPLGAQIEPLGPEQRLNGSEQFKERNPISFYTADGGFMVVWENEEMGLRGRRFDPDAKARGSNVALVDNQRLPEYPGDGPVVYRYEPAGVPLPNGDFLLFWMEEEAIHHVYYFYFRKEVQDRDVWGQRFSASGQPRGERFRVNQNRAGFQHHPSATLAPGGKVLVAWDSEGEAAAQQGAFVRLLNLDGKPLGDEVRLAGGTARYPALAANGEGRFLAAWEACCDASGDHGVFARFLDEAAGPVGEAFGINSSSLGHQRWPDVAADPWSNFFVVWHGQFEDDSRQSRIYAQAVGRDGAMLGPEVRISEEGGGAQVSPSIAPSERGGFFVFWLDYVDNWFPRGVFGVEVDALGNPISSELAISRDPIGAQFKISVSSNGKGQILTTWQGFHGQDHGVTGRRLFVSEIAAAQQGLGAQP